MATDKERGEREIVCLSQVGYGEGERERERDSLLESNWLRIRREGEREMEIEKESETCDLPATTSRSGPPMIPSTGGRVRSTRPANWSCGTG